MHFGVDVDREDVCDMILDKPSAQSFEKSIDEQYWYELILDDLPMWGMVGEVLRDEQHGRMEKVTSSMFFSLKLSLRSTFLRIEV